MGTSQPPPIEDVEELLDDIDDAIRELQPDGDHLDAADSASAQSEDEA